ncbi:hypothetical protein JGU66_16145 [Myxococcaceae bacterium JPH2]|nr:hypothetical protein [Myxococcaceae bacterium JPH2]
MESLFDRVGLGGVVNDAREMLRYYVQGRAPDVSRSASPRTSSPVPDGSVERVEVPEFSGAAFLPMTGRMEVRPAEARRKPAKSAGVRVKKAAVKKARPAAKKAAAGVRKKPAARKKVARAPEPGDVVGQLVDALRSHPKESVLVSAGRQKDQLLRSLIPLYLARSLDVEVTSGTMSRFWGEFGVTYAAPNAAKALRLHAGYAQDTKKGKAITSKGVKYVEEALSQLRA